MKKKKALSILLTAAMVLTMTASPVFAADEAPNSGGIEKTELEQAKQVADSKNGEGTLTIQFNEEGTYNVEPSEEELTVLPDPDNDGEHSGANPLPDGRKDSSTIVIDETLAAEYSNIVLMGVTDCYRVRVEEGVIVKLTLRGLEITTQSGRIWEKKDNGSYSPCDSAKTPYPKSRIYYSPIDIGDGANVTLTLAGNNKLTVAALTGGESDDYFATHLTDPAIHFAVGSLTIEGNGELSLEQQGVAEDADGGAALIGTAAGEDLTGSITIEDSANIIATVNGGGAAIGTGAGGGMSGTSISNARNITIKDSAKVTATANGGGAAIGTGAGESSKGGVIEIASTSAGEDCTVTATANGGGAAIGSGRGAVLRTEIEIIGPVEVTATAEGGGAAIGSGQKGDIEGYGRITIDNGDSFASKESTEFSPNINASVRGGAAAVIGCGENGSIGSTSEINIGGTAVITLYENNSTKEGYVPGAAIGVGGYKEGGDETEIRGDGNRQISIENRDDGNEVIGYMPEITIYGNGWIGLTGGKEHNGVKVSDAVKSQMKTYPYSKEEESQEPATPSTPSGGSVTPSKPVTDRISGDDRFETAVNVANQLKKELGVVKFNSIVVAGSDVFADALSASALASEKEAPVLLVNENTEGFVREYIEENLAGGGTVYIVGGNAVVTESFEDSIKNCTVERLGGSDRYATNLLVLKELNLNSSDEILVASGLGYPDALSASSTGEPVLLTGKNLTGGQIEFLQALAGDQCYIAGGTAAVGTSVEKALKEAGYTRIERIGGADRYETSALLAEEFYVRSNIAYLASGDDFPDGLTGGILAALSRDGKGEPLLLVNDRNTKEAASYIEAAGVRTVKAIGGTAAVSDEVLKAVI